MRIFYIDWQQHWECDRTVNIGYQQNSNKWQTSVDSWASSDIGKGIELVFKSLDCFTKRLFHTVTIFFHQADYKIEEGFLFFFSFFFLPRFGAGVMCKLFWIVCICRDTWVCTLKFWSHWLYFIIPPPPPPPPPFNKVERGVYWFHVIRPSVRLWTKSCPLCIFHNTCRIHFIFAHLIEQLQKLCCM